jgi:hypothetical protein
VAFRNSQQDCRLPIEIDRGLAFSSTHRDLILALASLGYQEEFLEVQLFKGISQRTNQDRTNLRLTFR